MAVAVAVFLLLADWQWERMEQRQERNAVISGQMSAPPLPLVDAQREAAAGPSDGLIWRAIDVRGVYDRAAEVLVRKRALEGQPGYLVVTPLRVGVGEYGGSLPIVRGWVPAAAVDGGQDAALSIPTVPDGTVAVTGRLRTLTPGPPRPADLPPGQVNDIPVPRDPALPGYYLELVDAAAGTEPGSPGADALIPLPPPNLGEGPHLYYAVQWVVFAAIAVGGFFILLHREVQERQPGMGAPSVPGRRNAADPASE